MMITARQPLAAPPRRAAASAEKPELPPDHSWLDTADIRTPVPTVEPGAWQNAKRYKTVIAGGGMGGLYTAWKSGGGPDTAIFERARHFGGRVHTAPVPGTSHPFDVGAMRFIPSQQHRVNALAEHFQIPVKDFPVGGANNLQYFRGKRLTNEQLERNPAAAPYKLACSEHGKTADQLLVKALDAVIPGFASLTPEELVAAMKTTTVEGVPLEQLGLMNILRRSLSQEAVRFISDSVGYESDLQNWDAGQAIQELTADFRPGTVYQVPVEGMSAFPKALVADLEKSGTELHRFHQLRRVEHDGHEFRLTFQDWEGNAVPVVAEKLVLNLPKVPLRAVVDDSPFLQCTPLERTLDKVTANPLTRIFLTFDKPWWNELGIQSGRSTTDLDLGMVYYFGGKDDATPYVEVYNDGRKSEFWEGLQNPGDPGVTTNLTAKPQLVKELKRQLEEMHGRALPEPTGVTYKRWADPLLGAGWHTWDPGSRPLEATEEMIHPLPDVPLYVCGEAFSTAQGWIEGALETGEKVATALVGADASRSARQTTR